MALRCELGQQLAVAGPSARFQCLSTQKRTGSKPPVSDIRTDPLPYGLCPGEWVNRPYSDDALCLGQGGSKRRTAAPGRRSAPGRSKQRPRRAGSCGAAPWIGPDKAGGPTGASRAAGPPTHRRVDVAGTGACPRWPWGDAVLCGPGLCSPSALHKAAPT